MRSRKSARPSGKDSRGGRPALCSLELPCRSQLFHLGLLHDGAVCIQRGDLLFRIGQALLQHLFIMLAQECRPKGNLDVRVGEMKGRFGNRGRTQQRMWHVLKQSACLQLRVGCGAGNIQDRRGRYAGFGQNFQGRFVIFKGLKPVFDIFPNLYASLDPILHGGVAFVRR